jgi:hypothetical protein
VLVGGAGQRLLPVLLLLLLLLAGCHASVAAGSCPCWHSCAAPCCGPGFGPGAATQASTGGSGQLSEKACMLHR